MTEIHKYDAKKGEYEIFVNEIQSKMLVRIRNKSIEEICKELNKNVADRYYWCVPVFESIDTL